MCISWSNKLTLIFFKVYILNICKLYPLFKCSAHTFFKKQEYPILNYWFDFYHWSSTKKYTNMLCIVKQIKMEKNIIESAVSLTLTNQCHDNDWQWTGLKYNNYGKNGYPIWQICALPSSWALIPLSMAAGFFRFLKFKKIFETFLPN